jgi:phage tail sheath protein FI
MSEPIIGIVFRRDDIEARPAIAADMSTIGIIGPMPDADDDIEINVPFKCYSNDPRTVRKVGKSGFVADAIEGINAQLGELQRAAQIILLRTAEGTGADANLKLQSTIGNIMGSSVQGTGLWALLLSGELVGAYPRVLIAPGYTSQMATGLDTLDLDEPGMGYIENDIYRLTFVKGVGDAGGTGVLPEAYCVGQPDGTLGLPIIESFGAYLTVPPTVTAPAPPVGTGTIQATVTATIATLGNPIVTMMPAILDQYLGHAIVESAGTSQQVDEDFRESINSMRIIPVVGGVKITDPYTGATVVRPIAPRIAGALIRMDHERGSAFYSACNQPIRGVLGPARRIRFSLHDGANEGQALLRFNMGFLAKGEIGDDFAIASGGYVFLGTDNAGEDELWRFYNQTRGRDFINLTLSRAERFYLGRYNVTAQVIRAIIMVVTNVLRDLQARDDILGFNVGFQGQLNSSDQIRQGYITISFKAEEPAPLRKVTNLHGRYRPAVERMVAQLESQLAIAA